LRPNTNNQSPIPNPQSPKIKRLFKIRNNKNNLFKLLNKIINIFKNK